MTETQAALTTELVVALEQWTAAHAGQLLVACLLLALALKVVGRRRPGPAQAAKALRKPIAQHARAQGRVTADELARALPLPKDGHGVPLGYTGGRRPKVVGVAWTAARGHVGVFGPTGAGKGFHCTSPCPKGRHRGMKILGRAGTLRPAARARGGRASSWCCEPALHLDPGVPRHHRLSLPPGVSTQSTRCRQGDTPPGRRQLGSEGRRPWRWCTSGVAG